MQNNILTNLNNHFPLLYERELQLEIEKQATYKEIKEDTVLIDIGSYIKCTTCNKKIN